MHRFIAGFAICLLTTLSTHAGTWIVTNTNDSGSSSLREAISETNSTPGADVITFQIAGGGVKTIALSTALPQITDVLTIDGFTQPGASANTSPNGLNAVVLIELDGITSGFQGLTFANAANGSTVRGLALGRFSGAIVALAGANITVSGNYVGTDATGTAQRMNATGLHLSSSGNQIGDANDVAARNLLSGNATGIQILSDDNVVARNLIGTTASGSAALANGSGIRLQGDDNDILMNVISGNGVYGILVTDGITGNVIDGNAIGTAVNGTSPLGNGTGITLIDGLGGAPTNTTITNNVIRFNTNDGIQVIGDLASQVRKPSTNSAGKPAALASPLGTLIDDNEIRDNGGLGIDIQDNGVTQNDPGDADGGANAWQNFPVITSAVASGSSIAVAGTLQSLPNSSFNVQLFHNDGCDGTGYGEGAFFLGEVTVTTDAGGNGAFNTAFSSASTTGVVTATATEIATGNTSEFSLCAALVAAPAATPIPTLTEIGLMLFAAAIALLAFLRVR